MNVIKEGMTSGQRYYQLHREKNKAAVLDYRHRHRRNVSDWNRWFYRMHREPKTEKAYEARYTYTRWDPFHYVDDETYSDNLKELNLYYLLNNKSGKLCVFTYKRFHADAPFRRYPEHSQHGETGAVHEKW